MHNLGSTRGALGRNHLLQTPDTFIRMVLPGMKRAQAIVHIAPAAGAAFSQMTVEFEAGGSMEAAPLAGVQRFFYVLEGSLTLQMEGRDEALTVGSYAYLPSGREHTVHTVEAARLVVIEKPASPLPDNTLAPHVCIGSEVFLPSTPLMGDADVQVRTLLPTADSFDFAVNTMTYTPGASLSMVEMHVMEHGLLMLEGGGIYRLDDQWYPVQTGDFIWMAPFCPQWFGALGKTPAKYLIYKDFNRHPLA